MQFRVGVVVLATLIIGALLMTLNSPLPTGWLPWGGGTYEIAIQLDEAPGIGPNTPVRKNGLLIGRVGSVEDLDDRVVVRANIDKDRKIFAQYTPVVRTSVLGDSTIDFITRSVPQGTQPVQDGEVMNGRVEPNPFEAIAKFADLKGDLQTTIDSLGKAGEEVAKLAKQVNEAFGGEGEEGRIGRLVETTERAMSEVGSAAASFNEILGAEAPTVPQPLNRDAPMPPHQALADGAAAGQSTRARLKQGLNDLPDLVHESRVTLQEFRQTLDLANKNFRNLEGITEPLGRRGEQISKSIIDSMDGLDRLIEEFTVLGQAVNSPTGTVGQLIHDRQLYDNLNRLLANANHVVLQANDIAKRLQIVVEDARVFMDKVAREPGRIVGGAVHPSMIK